MVSQVRLSLCLLAAWSALTLAALLMCAGSAGAAQAVEAGPLPAQPAAPSPVHGASDLRRLTHDGQSTPWAWTPDGRHLLVQRPGQISDQQQLSELWLVSVETGAERRLSDNALHPAAHGSQLAYLAYQAPGEWQAVVADLYTGERLQSRPALWTAPPRWVTGSALHLAPSGRWATFQGDAPSLAPSPLPAARARLSPDGRYVASTDGRALVVSGPDGAQEIARPGQVYSLNWSPDGARLAYVTAEGGPLPVLWVWERQSGQALALLRGELEHLGEPAWSPDGRTLALARTPTGSAAAGDLWLVEVDAPQRARPLAITEADERAPCWSPDGRQLAFASDGDLYVADLGAPPQSPLSVIARSASDKAIPDGQISAALFRTVEIASSQRALLAMTGPRDLAAAGEEPGWGQIEPYGLAAPETIYVMHDARGNTCRNVPDGQIDAIPFEQYVKQVTPQEVPGSWPAETLKTQAVAARTYGWVKWLYQGDRPYTVKDSTADQYMCDTTYPSTDSAVDATLGQYVAYEGRVIWSFYCAEAGTPTNYRQFRPDIPYLRPVHDPGALGKARRGHSWGMSQWGAYRWAADHGWTYPQILAFYYSGATVEPSTARVWPLAAVVRPASDSFITSDTADLRALATSARSTWPESGVLTVTFSARLTETWTTIYTDTTPADGWGTLWPVGALSDTMAPSIALRATAYDLVGWKQESEPSYVGLNRTPPAGTLALAGSVTEVTTLTLSLAVSATDPSPTHLPLRVSLGAEGEVWEDRDATASAGALVSDTSAWDGSAWHVEQGQPATLASTEGQHLPAGAYRLWVRLRVPAQALDHPGELARLAILNGEDELLAVHYPRGTAFKAADTYQEFGLDLVTAEEQAVWWRVDIFGVSDLWLDRISVASLPVPLPGEGAPLAWSLPPREGTLTVVARYVDGAENTSPRVPMAVTVVDRSPPAGWRDLACLERACSIQVRDAIAGLDPRSGAGRVSLDGGLTWSAWVSATCTGEPGSHGWERLALPDLLPELLAPEKLAPEKLGPEIPPDCQAQVQFRVRDAAAAANKGLSPVYAFDACYHVYMPLVAGSATTDPSGP